jgi:integrase
MPFFCTASGGYADPSNVHRAFAAILKEAKLPDFTPHGLRHTFEASSSRRASTSTT